VELAGGGVVGWFCASVEHARMKGGAASGAVLRAELVRAQKAVAPSKEEILSVALVKGDGERLSVREEDELMDLVEDAEARQDFHTANRIERFLDSVPDFPKG